jgi:hypothetical protein
MKKIDKVKLLNIIVVGVFLIGAVSVNYFWGRCIEYGCRSGVVGDFLRPLFYSSLSLAGFFGFFILLPAHYFTSWLKKIFSWAFPVSVLILLQEMSSTGGLFPIYEREVIILLSGFFGVVTLFFVMVHYFKTK